MIEISVHNGKVNSSGHGTPIQLLAELPVGVVVALYKILKDAPDAQFKEDMIKMFFEHVLQVMKEEEKDDGQE